MAKILPNSVPRETKTVDGLHPLARQRIPWLKIFCANCGADGGFVPEDGPKFAFYLCRICAEKWAPLPGTMITPDEAFWQTMQSEQEEKYGRQLKPEELVEQLNQDTSLARLARDRKG